MATRYLIKKKTHSFLTQQLNIFYPPKDSRCLLFSKVPSESLNPSRSFLKCFFLYLLLLPILFSYIFFYFYLFPGILEFWCLVTVTFKFTVLYNNICRRKKKYLHGWFLHGGNIDNNDQITCHKISRFLTVHSAFQIFYTILDFEFFLSFVWSKLSRGKLCCHCNWCSSHVCKPIASIMFCITIGNHLRYWN